MSAARAAPRPPGRARASDRATGARASDRATGARGTGDRATAGRTPSPPPCRAVSRAPSPDQRKTPMHQHAKAPAMALARLVLASGRPVDLADLRLSSTYGHMREGYPCKPVNDLRIRALVRAAERAHPGAPVHLVPPPREYPDQYAGGLGPVEVLPAVACLGTFQSAALDPARDPVAYRSRLVVVWFQSSPRLPSGCDAEPALRDLDWSGLARDGRALA